MLRFQDGTAEYHQAVPVLRRSHSVGEASINCHQGRSDPLGQREVDAVIHRSIQF